MKKETELDIREYVSDCFNHRESRHADSAYMRLSRLMIEKYGFEDYHVEEIAGSIEAWVSEYIAEHSPKLSDND
jgi:hypothetical protein